MLTIPDILKKSNGAVKQKKQFILIAVMQMFLYAIIVSAQEIPVFPTPQKVTINTTKEFLLDSTAKIIVPANATQRDLSTAQELSEIIYSLTKNRIRVIKWEQKFQEGNIIFIGQPSEDINSAALLKSLQITLPSAKEGYVLNVGEKEIIVAGSDAAGTFYGAQTLRQLFQKTGTALKIPPVTITDSPDMKYRGLFIENKWGSDLMTLQDYQELIDWMSQLKYNSLAIGIYGCWNVQFRNTITEFFLLPLKPFPELKTPKFIEYYSPRHASWKGIDYLPAMFQQDFLGQLIGYGQQHFITVRPKFNSLGHNTLIPRLHPEISAVDSNGTPLNEGFCTSNEKTYSVLFSIFDDIIERYLKPNNITAFDLQLDEVRKWCACPQCRLVSQEERYLRHIIRLAIHLRDKGIKDIGVWADMLESRYLFSKDLVKRFSDAGLTNQIIFQWWHYERNPYTSTRPELGFRTWVVPMTGYLYLYHYSYAIPRITNVYQMLRLGHTDHAEGAESYCIYDPAYHRSNVALAEWAWHHPDLQNENHALVQFNKKYAQSFFGNFRDEAIANFEKLDDIYLNYTQGLLGSILYYNYSYVRSIPYKKRPYPQEAYQTMEKDPIKWDKLSAAAVSLEQVKNFFRKVIAEQPDNEIAWQKLTNVTYSANLSQIFLILKEMEQKYQSLRKLQDKELMLSQVSVIEVLTEKMRTLQIESLSLWETHKLAYLLPHNLRNMSFMIKYLDELNATLKIVKNTIKTEAFSELPQTLITGTLVEL